MHADPVVGQGQESPGGRTKRRATRMNGVVPGVLVLSYLIGSVPTGLVLVRLLKGEDIRK